VDGSGFRKKGERTNKPVAYFRPAIGLKGRDLTLYTIPPFGSRGGNSHHRVLPVYEPPAWVFCDLGSFSKETKRCYFTPYNTETAQYIEEQLVSGRKSYSFSLTINKKKVDYVIRPTDNPEVFVQERVTDRTIHRDVLRVSNKTAREMQIRREIRSLAPKRSSGRALLDTLLQTEIDVEQFDALYESETSEYKSANYGMLIEQRNIFNDNYGNLSRQEAYHIMSELGSLNTVLTIKFD